MISLPPARTVRLARAIALGSAFVLAMASCQTAPDRSIPDPLPETLGWALPPTDGTAFLGLEVRENDSGSLESLSFDPGVRVHKVIERSPAAGAGMRMDDVVLAMNGVELAVPEDLAALLSRAGGGDRTTLQISRGDTVFEVELTLGGKDVADAPSAGEAFVLDPARSRGAWGTSDGAVLVARAADGPVGRLDVGARVVALDGDPIVSGRGLVQRLVARAPGERVTLTVKTGDRVRDVEVTLLDEGRRTTRISFPILATYDAAPDRSREEFVAIDLYFISLFRYAREGGEKRWSFLRFFQFASGVGELDG